MGKKKEYKDANRRFLKKLSFQEGVFAVSYTHLTLPTILRV